MARKMIVELTDGGTPVLTESLADNEQQLQELVKAHPDLIPVEEFGFVGPLMVVGRETYLQSGAVDLLGVARGGELLVVELQNEPPDAGSRLQAGVGDKGSVFGPAEVRGRSRWLVQGRDLRSTRIALRRLVQDWRDGGTRVRVDADPEEL